MAPPDAGGPGVIFSKQYVSLCVSWCLPVLCQYLPVTVVNTTEKLTALRQQMHTNNLSAYIIPNTDAHMVRNGSTPTLALSATLERPMRTGRKQIVKTQEMKAQEVFDRQREGNGELGHGSLGQLKECTPLHRREDIAKS